MEIHHFLKLAEECIILFLSSFIKQFTASMNLWILYLGIVFLVPVFYFDRKILEFLKEIPFPKAFNFASKLSPLLSFPIISFMGLFLGIYLKDDKLILFSKEYFATMYLALAESGLISFIFIHERPEKGHLSFWETAFRSHSSFPSGHVIPYAALSIKAYQFYGIGISVIPMFLLILTSLERMRSRKHYLSDVIGGILLCFFAAFGARVF